MSDDLDDFYVHTCQVETLQGTTGYGETTYSAPVTVPCFLSDTRHLVRGKDMEQVISESQVYCNPQYADLFTPGSRVTTGTDVSTVIRANSNTSGPLDLPDHVVISLT